MMVSAQHRKERDANREVAKVSKLLEEDEERYRQQEARFAEMWAEDDDMIQKRQEREKRLTDRARDLAVAHCVMKMQRWWRGRKQVLHEIEARAQVVATVQANVSMRVHRDRLERERSATVAQGEDFTVAHQKETEDARLAELIKAEEDQERRTLFEEEYAAMEQAQAQARAERLKAAEETIDDLKDEINRSSGDDDEEDDTVQKMFHEIRGRHRKKARKREMIQRIQTSRDQHAEEQRSPKPDHSIEVLVATPLKSGKSSNALQLEISRAVERRVAAIEVAKNRAAADDADAHRRLQEAYDYRRKDNSGDDTWVGKEDARAGVRATSHANVRKRAHRLLAQQEDTEVSQLERAAQAAIAAAKEAQLARIRAQQAYEDAAALKIQCVERARQSRRFAASKRSAVEAAAAAKRAGQDALEARVAHLKAREREEEAAAIKIQAVSRARSARRRYAVERGQDEKAQAALDYLDREPPREPQGTSSGHNDLQKAMSWYRLDGVAVSSDPASREESRERPMALSPSQSRLRQALEDTAAAPSARGSTVSDPAKVSVELELVDKLRRDLEDHKVHAALLQKQAQESIDASISRWQAHQEEDRAKATLEMEAMRATEVWATQAALQERERKLEESERRVEEHQRLLSEREQKGVQEMENLLAAQAEMSQKLQEEAARIQREATASAAKIYEDARREADQIGLSALEEARRIYEGDSEELLVRDDEKRGGQREALEGQDGNDDYEDDFIDDEQDEREDKGWSPVDEAAAASSSLPPDPEGLFAALEGEAAFEGELLTPHHAANLPVEEASRDGLSSVSGYIAPHGAYSMSRRRQRLESARLTAGLASTHLGSCRSPEEIVCAPLPIGHTARELSPEEVVAEELADDMKREAAKHVGELEALESLPSEAFLAGGSELLPEPRSPLLGRYSQSPLVLKHSGARPPEVLSNVSDRAGLRSTEDRQTAIDAAVDQIIFDSSSSHHHRRPHRRPSLEDLDRDWIEEMSGTIYDFNQVVDDTTPKSGWEWLHRGRSATEKKGSKDNGQRKKERRGVASKPKRLTATVAAASKGTKQATKARKKPGGATKSTVRRGTAVHS